VQRLSDCLNSPVQGTGAAGLKLALALLWEQRDECPGAGQVLACHDEIVVEWAAKQVDDVRVWLETAMVEGIKCCLLHGTGETQVTVEVCRQNSKNKRGSRVCFGTFVQQHAINRKRAHR
jgi:hypothetical protein